MANGNKIPKDKAIEWVKRYKDKHDTTRCILYDASMFQEILAVPGCVSVRIHFAENDDKVNCLVFVAVDKDGNAILSATQSTTPNFIWDDGLKCPTDCPTGDL
jgi:hypothetical protein